MYKKQKIAYGVVVMVLVMLFFGGIKFKNEMEMNSFSKSVNLVQENVKIPGVKKTYRFLFLTDTHIIIKEREEIGCFGKTDSRIELFKNQKGQESKEDFPKWMKFANNQKYDAVIMGGDMIDYLTPENVKFVKKNLKHLKMPYLYTMGNHESYIPWDNLGFQKKDKNLLGLFQNQNSEVQVLEYPEFKIVSVNDFGINAFGAVSKDALKGLQKECKEKKPIILVLHVPITTEKSQKLYDDTVARHGSAMLLGRNCGYKLDKNAKEFLNLIEDKKTPIVAVFAGHLHFYHKDMITDKMVQVVADASYKNTGMVINVTKE